MLLLSSPRFSLTSLRTSIKARLSCFSVSARSSRSASSTSDTRAVLLKNARTEVSLRCNRSTNSWTSRTLPNRSSLLFDSV